MLHRLIAVPLLAYFIAFVVPAFGHDMTGVSFWEHDGKTYVIDLTQILDAEPLLGAGAHKRYEGFLSEAKCDAAGELILKAFVDRYPQIPGIETTLDKSGNKHWSWHQGFILDKFWDLSFCDIVQNLEAYPTSESAKAANIGYYLHDDRDEEYVNKTEWFLFNRSIKRLIELTDHGYLPALSYLAELAERGFIFENSVEVEYFLRTRACAMHYECEKMKDRITEIEEKLPADRAATLKANAIDFYAKGLQSYFPNNQTAKPLFWESKE
ncbi:MAG: hypothetical protein ACR2OJ_05425 [Hyphomicrobiales bacterium]